MAQVQHLSGSKCEIEDKTHFVVWLASRLHNRKEGLQTIYNLTHFLFVLIVINQLFMTLLVCHCVHYYRHGLADLAT